MADPGRVTLASFSSSSAAEQRTGLLGWVGIQVDGLLLLDGIAVRRTAAGDLRLSFPAREDSRGRRHPLVRPLDDASRQSIEAQVLAALGVEGVR